MEKLSVDRFALSSSRAEEDIKTFIGLEFTKTYPLVELTPRNSAALILEGFRKKKLIAILFSFKSSFFMDGISFVKRGRFKEFAELHETMHGWCDEINPQLKGLSREPISKTRILIEEIERFGAANIMLEGLCSWIAAEVIWQRQGKSMLTEAPERQQLKQKMQSLAKGDELILDLDMHELKRMASGSIINIIAATRKLLGLKGDKFYSLGFNFVWDVITDLTQAMPLNLAIDIIVKNPPKTIADLKNPTFYAEQLKKLTS